MRQLHLLASIFELSLALYWKGVSYDRCNIIKIVTVLTFIRHALIAPNKKTVH